MTLHVRHKCHWTKLDEARDHYERAIARDEAALGPQHEKIAETLVRWYAAPAPSRSRCPTT